MKKWSAFGLLLGLLFFFETVAAEQPELWSYWDKSNESNYNDIDHGDWDALLKKYVVTNHPSGINRFRYGSVSKEDSKKLDQYIKMLAGADPREYNKNVQKAYWINLYNALTVQLVLAHFPIDSITDIRGKGGKQGPWDNALIKINGKKLSLNDIEHRILRPIWQDHRIHFALNSASLGSPQVLPHALTQANTRILLKQAGKDFINHPRGVLLEKDKLQVSSLFDWYRQDFGSDDNALKKIFAHYADDKLALYLLGFQGQIVYQHDWALNGL